MDEGKTLEDLIAEFAPNVSWVDKASLPTADDIRQRVAEIPPEQKAAILAELEKMERNQQI